MSLSSQRTHGFTLIELLTVMVIFAVIASFATLSISNDPHKIIENSAKRFVQQFTLISEESALYGLDYGLRIDEESYTFWHWDQLQWRRPEDVSIAKPVSFPQELTVELILEQGSLLEFETIEENNLFDPEEEELEEPPQILVLSSGEVTPFVLQFRSVNSDDYLEVKIDTLGRATVERIDAI